LDLGKIIVINSLKSDGKAWGTVSQSACQVPAKCPVDR